jgi:glycosyltransferase involved in cell wall biosynthesis
MNPQHPEFAACTIIAKNYLPMARVLAESWHRFHPACPFFVLLLDSPGGFFSPEVEAFLPVYVSDLDITNLGGFLFKYTVLEASTAVKPYLLKYLFRRHSVEKLLYLDPDILVLNSLEQLRNNLDGENILLTPHLLSPLPKDGRGQEDHDILQAGTYNLGFIGLRNTLESQRFLRWWADKLYHQCIVSFEHNLFVDQRWIDLIPGMFDRVQIIREPGYNAAYWNLHERTISTENNNSVECNVKVNGKPLYFFHFSGFNPDKPSVVSKYQNRFDMDNIGDTRKLYTRYRELLVENGWHETRLWNYGHDFFSNGVRIPASARRYYWSLGPDVPELGNPFSWLDTPSPDVGFKRVDLTTVTDLKVGVNLLGYFESEKGVGEAARSNRRIIHATGLPYVLNNYIDTGSSNVERVSGQLTNDNIYLTNLMTVNADGLQIFAKDRGSYLNGHFNIGYWAWELPEFPEEWASAFGYVDEIWTPSAFTRDAVAACSPVPVRVVPHSMDMEADMNSVPDRAEFGLDPEAFVFLFLFDFHSFLERKNPLGLMRAYKNAFGNRHDVQLLIKSSHSREHQEELLRFQDEAKDANVRILDGVLSREAKQRLIQAADCYISLHRSEGFGLTMAEAMMCGKPVIGTGYSGNVDFMSDEDSFLVPYRLVTIDRTHGPYKAGYHWGDPDLDSAVDLMRYVEGNREIAALKGVKARANIIESLHPATIAASVRARLKELGCWDNGPVADAKVTRTRA